MIRCADELLDLGQLELVEERERRVTDMLRELVDVLRRP